MNDLLWCSSPLPWRSQHSPGLCCVLSPSSPIFKSIWASCFCQLQQEESGNCTFVLMSWKIQVFKDMEIINGRVFKWKYIYISSTKKSNLYLNCVWLLWLLDCVRLVDCYVRLCFPKKTKIIIDYALDSKELLKTFVLQRILQHPALEKAMFPAYPILSSCWANRQISSWNSSTHLWLMGPFPHLS